MTEWRIICGDALEEMRKVPDNSLDGMLTDPPAGIKFAGKEWDSDKGGRDKWIAWLEAIMREAYRALKPGAMGLVWSLPRTQHWTGMALDLAGFEIRDCIVHLVGNRMPKNLNVSKAIDQKLGATRKKVGTKRLGGNAAVSLKDKGGTYGVQVGTAPAIDIDITEAGSPEAARWEGYGTGLRALAEYWWLVRKPLDGTVINNAMKWGTGTIDVNGCRIGEREYSQDEWTAKSASRTSGMGYGTHRPSNDPVPEGRWPANAMLGHSPWCKPTGEIRTVDGYAINRFIDGAKPFGGGAGHEFTSETMPDERRTVWDCVVCCPIRQLDESVGDRPSTLAGRADPGGSHENPGDNGGASSFGGGNSRVYADNGGASRFYQNTWTTEEEMAESHFIFTTKVSTAERESGCEHLPVHSRKESLGRDEDSVGINNGRAGAGRTGDRHNPHPTLKSLKLCEYLGRLILPPPHADGSPRRICSMFAGAGSELTGALLAGWEECLGIELDPSNCLIAEARIKYWTEKRAAENAAAQAKLAATEQQDLFGKVGS